MKSTFKYVAAHLHHFETNKHGFWSEGVWVMDITEATLYNSPLKAETHGGKKTHPIKVEIAMAADEASSLWVWSQRERSSTFTMTKETLLAIVRTTPDKQELFYCDNGPNKHEQEDHYNQGYNVVGMNVELLSRWLQTHSDEAQETFDELPKADRREIWEASNFHNGIIGYDRDDADFWWKTTRD